MVCEKTGKLAFSSPGAADRRRRMIKRKRSDRLVVYRCGICGRWHLGHALKFPKPPKG
jgi:hypothetical protein